MDLPGVIEVTEFKFVQLKKVFISPDVPSSSVNCIATSNKYSLLFIGYSKGFKIIRVETILELDETSQGKDKSQPANNYNHRDVALSSSPSALALSCDETTLSVSILKDDVPFALMYDVRAFAANEPPYPFAEVRLSATPGTKLRQFCWNPSVPSEFAICLTDGSATVYGIEIETLKISGNLTAAEGVTALCWSPKGKQIVAGRRDGRLCQHKPNFQLSKIIPPPSAIGENSYVASISWLATTLFAAVYVQRNGADNSTKLVLVSVPKGQSPTYTDFGDVCYGNGEREVTYWMQHIPEWKILICTSSNSLETAVIGYDDQGVWQQWSLEGTARAELPLFQRQETYPLGAGIVTCSSKNIVISPTESHPPMPILFLFSTSGLLCPFHIVNLFPGQPNLVTQPQPLSAEGQRKGKPPPPTSLPLGQPFQASTPVQRPYQEQATSNPPEYVPAAKTNLMKKFPEDNSNSQPTFSFAKLPQISSGNEEAASKSSKLAPFSVENQNQASNYQSDVSSMTNKGVDLSQDSGGGLNRKISRNILTPIAPSKTVTSVSKPSAPIPNPDTEKVGVENALTAALLEELKEFTKEIKESRQMLSQSQDSVGSDDEMTQIRNQTHEMRVFCEDIKKTVQSINLDVHLLKGCLFDTFAIFAEARSLDLRNKDPIYLSLLKKRALDPVSARKLKDIRKMCQYFDTQLSEIHSRLDQDWQDYLDRRKRSTSAQRKNHSGVETVYRTLYNNLNAIKGLEDRVDKLMNDTKRKKLSFLSNTPRSRTTIETRNTFDEDLSTLADSLLKTKITVSSSTSKVNSGVTKNAPKAMAAEKENALREFLLNRRVPTVKATTINNLKDSRLLSTIQIMKETSSHWNGIERSQNNSDISKSDSEIKEVLSSKESGGLSSSGLKPVFNSLTEPNWPATTGMSTSAKSSFSSIASGDTVITSNTMIPVSKSENLYTGGITQGTPLTSSKSETVKKSEPQTKPFQTVSNQIAPPNITLPFHSPPIHMVAKTNAAIVSAPIMVPITAKNESKTIPASQIQTQTTKQMPVFNFGKTAPTAVASNSSFVFSKSPESTGFGPIKICEPTSFTAIGKPLAAISNESKSFTSNSSLFSFKEPTSLFSSSGNKNIVTTLQTTPGVLGSSGSLFKELGNTTIGSGATAGSLFKEPVSSGTLFKELTGVTQASGSSTESRSISEAQYEDITPPETPSQSDLISKDDENEEMTKVIEISVPNSTPEVKIKSIPSSIAAGFSFNPNLVSTTNVTPTTSAKASFSLAHLHKSDNEAPKPSGFQFGGVSTKDGAPSFNFTVPSINNSTSSTSTINSTKMTITPIAVSSGATTSSPVLNSVTASNVTIPTNASSTAFTPVTSSLDKETPIAKPEEKESIKVDDHSSITKESETENNQPEVKSTPTSEQQPPPPPYPTGQAAFPTSTITSTSGAPTFGVGSSLFGKPTAQRNLFGQPTPETSFGQPSTTSQSSGSLFGNLTSFGQSKPSTFGQPVSSTSAPVFGSVSSPNTPFGTPNNAPVGIFGSPVTSQSFGQSTQSSGFGAFGQQTPSTFSQAGNSSGGAFSISQPLFGQSGPSVFGQVTKPATNSPSGSLFGQQSSTSSIFDQNTSFFGGLGGQPSAENANKNVFGAQSFQNQSPSSGGLFGNQSPGGFGTKFGNSSFTGGSFSAGGTSVAETGFGAFNQAEQQQNTPTKLSTGASPGFGAPPVFGGSPVFGSNTFGISPVQQNTGAFQSSPFGSTNTTTPMFDALASQAPTFGSLSQQPTAAPSFGNVPSGFGSSSSSFGGQSSGIGSQSSAFTQWRQ